MRGIWCGLLAIAVILACGGCREQTAQPADTTELVALIEKAERIDESVYTTASYTSLKHAVSSSAALLADENATQPQVDRAVEELTNSLEGLTVATQGVYRLYCRLVLQSNDMVGNEWMQAFACNGQVIESGAAVAAPLGACITVEATVTEEDRYPDVGTGSVRLSAENGFTETVEIVVKENGGPYAGRVAVWCFICTAELVERL